MCDRPDRRLFFGRLGAIGLATSGVLLGAPRRAAAAGALDAVSARSLAPGERWLELFNTHTSETLSIAYRNASGFVATALQSLNWLLRDHRAEAVAPIDPLLFDQLTALAHAAGREARFEVISGYRSPLTNGRLAEEGRGVATRSLHMEGRAIDVRLRGFSTAELRDLALDAAAGGVGYYARSNFLHIDTGRLRAWTG